MRFRFNIMLFVFFAASYLLQSYCVYPVEAGLRGDPSVELYSFCYLPHGFKAIAVVLIGGQALIPMILANIAVDLSTGMEIARAIKAGVLGTGCFAIGLVILNLLKTQTIFSSPFNASAPALQNFLALLAIATISSLVNGLSSSFFWGSAVDEIAIMFFIGDLFGVVVVFILFQLANKKLVKLIHLLTKREISLS